MTTRINQFARDNLNIHITDDMLEKYPVIRHKYTGELYQAYKDNPNEIAKFVKNGWEMLSTDESIKFIETLYFYFLVSKD
jgi:hypothetical protein